MKLFFWTFYLRIVMCQISFCQMFLNLERSLCHLNYTQTNLHTKFLGILCGSRNCDRTHTPTTLIEYDLTRLFQPLLMFPKKKKKKRSPSKRVWLPKTWFGHTQQSPVPGNTGGQKNDTFGGHIGKEPRLMNHTHTYIHIRSKQGVEKRNTLTHVWNIQAKKKERRGKLRKQEENMKKLLLEL